jgi:hypothetical protein
MTFRADEEGFLTIRVMSSGEARTEPGDDPTVAKARAVVTALGGRLRGTHPAEEGLTILLPRR